MTQHIKAKPLESPVQSLKDASKAAGQNVMKSSFVRKVLTSKWAFRAIVVTVIFIPISIIIGVLISQFQAQPYGTNTIKFAALFVYGVALFVLRVFLILGTLSAIYLTLTKSWPAFRRWWAIGRARVKDRRSSVTYSRLLARLHLQHHSADRGTLLTMLPEQKRLGYKKRKLTYEDDRHVTLIGGTRGGKGTSFIVPNLLHHKGSVVCFDPAGENFALTAAYRQQVLRQNVIALDPFGVTKRSGHAWNPLSEIDFNNDPQALNKCYALAESLIERGGKDPYWTDAGQDLLAMSCAYVGLRSIAENLHLPQVYDLLHGEDLAPLWTAMSHCEGMDGAVSRYGAACLAREEREFSGVMQTLRTALRFIATPVMRQNLSKPDFAMSSLKDGNTTVYIVLPAGAGATYKGWIRMIFDSAFNAMQDMSTPNPEIPTLFLMDEFPLLGHMERIKRAAGEAAKFGVKLFICAQDISQLKEIYGDAWESFVGNSGLTIMFANNDLTTQKYLSEKLGKEYYTKISTSSSSSVGQQSSSSSSSSSSQELRDVARPDEIAKMAHRGSGLAYFLIPEMKPMCLPRAPYFAWDMIPEGLKFDDTRVMKTNVALPPESIAAE